MIAVRYFLLLSECSTVSLFNCEQAKRRRSCATAWRWRRASSPAWGSTCSSSPAFSSSTSSSRSFDDESPWTRCLRTGCRTLERPTAAAAAAASPVIADAVAASRCSPPSRCSTLPRSSCASSATRSCAAWVAASRATQP